MSKSHSQTLSIFPSLFFKYIDANRIFEGMSVEEFCNNHNHMDIEWMSNTRSILMNSNASKELRYNALDALCIYSSMRTWMYYKKEYIVKLNI